MKGTADPQPAGLLFGIMSKKRLIVWFSATPFLTDEEQVGVVATINYGNKDGTSLQPDATAPFDIVFAAGRALGRGFPFHYHSGKPNTITHP